MKVKGSKKFHFVKFLKKALILSVFGTVSEIWISLENIVNLGIKKKGASKPPFFVSKGSKILRNLV